MPTLAPNRASRQFLPISALTLSCCTELGVDVFLKVDVNATPQLFCSRRLHVKPQQLQHLLVEGVTKLYIRSDSYESYLAHLCSNWKLLLHGDHLAEANRTALMYDIVRSVLSDQFSHNDSSSIVDTCFELSHSIIHILQERPVRVSGLYDLMCHDYSIVTHSSNGAIYVAKLATELGFTLEEVATMNIEKLYSRMDRAKLGGSGDNR